MINTEYQFTLYASNASGLGPGSTFRSVEPGNKPGAPTSVIATTSGSTGAIITWVPPVSDGGALIKWYTINTNSSDSNENVAKQNTEGFNSTFTIGGLTGGNSYSFLVRAVNDPGYSPLTSISNFLTRLFAC